MKYFLARCLLSDSTLHTEPSYKLDRAVWTTRIGAITSGQRGTSPAARVLQLSRPLISCRPSRLESDRSTQRKSDRDELSKNVHTLLLSADALLFGTFRRHLSRLSDFLPVRTSRVKQSSRWKQNLLQVLPLRPTTFLSNKATSVRSEIYSPSLKTGTSTTMDTLSTLPLPLRRTLYHQDRTLPTC